MAGYLSKSFGLVPSGRKNRLVRFSRSLSQRFTMRFSPHTLGNLIHRTRLKLAASMLHFQEYGDFADYFGSRWHYYLGAIIAAIPVPFLWHLRHLFLACGLMNRLAEYAVWQFS